ncbi:hypothetical protein D3C72_2041450 [compost metagenome]
MHDIYSAGDLSGDYLYRRDDKLLVKQYLRKTREDFSYARAFSRESYAYKKVKLVKWR